MSGVIDHANVTAKLDILQLLSADLGVGGFATLPVLTDWSAQISNGTGAGQASQVYQDTLSLGPSASSNLDLAGSLLNIFGQTITFTKIRLIAVRASPNNNAANTLAVIRGSSNGVPLFGAASGGFAGLNPGAWFIYYDPTGITVTAATGDILTLTNNAGTNTISADIVIVGTD
jgi:hypothetical protein